MREEERYKSLFKNTLAKIFEHSYRDEVEAMSSAAEWSVDKEVFGEFSGGDS